MKTIAIVLLFISSNILGQDNPMFDSIDYYHRNKIKSIHYNLSTWDYSPGWKYIKFSFDKRTNILNCDTIIYDDPSSPLAKTMKKLGVRDFSIKDTVYHTSGLTYSNVIKHYFDKKGRLLKKLNIAENCSLNQAITASDKTDNSTSFLKDSKSDTTTTNYFYADSSSKRLIKTITESPYYTEERIFFYKNNLLTKRVNTMTRKNDKDISVDTFLYEYYPDKKLKKETRKVKNSRCKTNCVGIIEYKYDTE